MPKAQCRIKHKNTEERDWVGNFSFLLCPVFRHAGWRGADKKRDGSRHFTEMTQKSNMARHKADCRKPVIAFAPICKVLLIFGGNWMQLKTINPAPVMQIIYPALLALEKETKKWPARASARRPWKHRQENGVALLLVFLKICAFTLF